MFPYYEFRSDERITLLHRTHTDSFPSHFHSEIELTYCLSGRQYVKIGNISYAVEKGDAVVIFPNMIHELVDCSDAPETETLTIVCDAELIWQNIPKIKGMVPESPLIKCEKLSRETALSFRKLKSAHDDLTKLGHTYIILSDLISSLSLRPLDYRNDANMAQRVTEYIAANFCEPLTLDFLCRKLNVSSSHLSHVFSNQLKIHFRTYLGAVRAEHSAGLIRTTSKNLTEIAFESGFDSLRTFNRTFKAHFGMTPSEYRKKLK